MQLTKLFREFFQSERSSGIILIACTALSLLLTNVFIGDAYTHFWHHDASVHAGFIQLDLSVEHWINDGLMAIFFLLVGLEIERELYIGELSSLNTASLPVIAAVGGMAIPALTHFLFNAGTPTQDGFGIPMATDIAFALGILSLAGKRVPASLKIFLTALAIIDDLGAILVIAIFYTETIHIAFLLSALGVFALLVILNRLRVKQLKWYLLGGVVMWYCMLQSGIHATISGVLLAFTIPFDDGGEKSPSYRLQHWLHKPVAFGIIPLFAFANTGVVFSGDINEVLLSRNSLGIIAGLVLGKPVGILLFCATAVRLRLARLPEGVNWQQLAGAGTLAGIGFTMSIFITLLAFRESALINASRIAILLASLLAGLIGFLLTKRAVRNCPEQTED